MPNILDLEGQKIKDTFQRIIQVDADKLYDGHGNLVLDLSTIPTSTGSNPIDQQFNVPSGTTTILQVNKTQYRGIFIDYVVYNDVGQRTGRLTVNSFNGEVDYFETCTNDLGSDTSNFEFDVIVNFVSFDIRTISPDNSFILKISYKYI